MAFVSLTMYPFAALRPAWERLWAAVHEFVPWMPSGLRWSGTVLDHSADAACALVHVCGWPVATVLRDKVTVVGAFNLDHPGAEGHHYCSTLISASEPGCSAWTDDCTAAVNGDDSLSGWISLACAAGGTWPGRVLSTGAHLESVRAVGDGRAGVASIDSTSWAHIGRLFPELARRVHVVGQGPRVPSPPLVVPVGTPQRCIDDIRQAMARALADPEIDAVRGELLVDGFVPLDDVDYEPILGLAPDDRSRRINR
ncbi:MAG: PhnD/SsuA/transferrin family substrate-binding protein [Ilumatobacteraceae bacterium]